MSQLSVERYDRTLENAYVDLLPHHQSDTLRAKLKWRYKQNPHGAGVAVLARDDAGKIVGMNGFQAADLGEAGRGHQSMDTIVSEEARGQGLFTRMLRYYYEHADSEVVYGFPNAKSAPGFFGKLGWLPLGPVPMLAKPLRTSLVAERLSIPVDLPLPRMPRLRASDAREAAGFDASWVERAWAAMHGGSEPSFALRRDEAYLNWRFVDHPQYDYLVLHTGTAYVVGRVADKHGTRIGYIMEAVGAPGEVARLLVAMTDHFRQHQAAVSFAWCLPSSANRAAFRRARFFTFPHRLRPIHLFFGARPIGSMTQLHDPSRWYISYTDSDTV